MLMTSYKYKEVVAVAKQPKRGVVHRLRRFAQRSAGLSRQDVKSESLYE
jgi:hypothetical protein